MKRKIALCLLYQTPGGLFYFQFQDNSELHKSEKVILLEPAKQQFNEKNISQLEAI